MINTEVIRVEIAKLDLLPGQVLIVRVPKTISSESIGHIDDALRNVLGRGCRWLIAADDMNFGVIDADPLGDAHA